MTAPVDDWSDAPSFGPRDAPRDASAAYVVRPSAYALLRDEVGQIAVVRTPKGLFLPGGGIDPGETAREAIQRETIEECGLPVRLRQWTTRAIEFVYSPEERTHFEKRSTFIDAVVDPVFEGALVPASEPDHELVWMSRAAAIESLSHASHRWAVEGWAG